MTDNRFLDIARKRRTQYALGNDLPLGQEEVTALIQEAVRQAPSSFNSQSSRALILHGAQSVKFWDIVKDELRKIVPADAFPTTEKKIDSFAAGAGTVLFYEDQGPVKALQEQAVAREWNIPEGWVLRAQMPFGSHAGEIGDKTYIDDAERFVVAA